MLESRDGLFRYHVRNALDSDLDSTITSWWLLVGEQSRLDKRVVPNERNMEQSKFFLTSLIARELLLLAVDETQKIIGMGTISPDNYFLVGGPSIWNIADVWVDNNYRRNGVATQLVISLQKLALKLGADEIRLEVYSKNQEALELYDSLGYGRLKETLHKKL